MILLLKDYGLVVRVRCDSKSKMEFFEIIKNINEELY